MPHEITVRSDGTAEAAFALTPAWHGLGAVIDHPMTSAEALQAARLDWFVEMAPVAAVIDDQYVPLTSHYATFRTDNKHVLGIVTKKYKIVQNREAFAFLDSLVEEGQMLYESAFSLSGGKKVILLARLPGEDEITQDDNLRRYLLLSISHDGTSGIKFGPTSVRVVCANTYALALEEGYIKTIEHLPKGVRIFENEMSISHVGSVDQKLAAARGVIKAANRAFDQYAELARKLAEVKLTKEQFQAFLDVMCPLPPEHDPDYTKRRADAIKDTRDHITKLFYDCERQNIPGIEQSAWAAFCAVTEHIDHLPRRGATPRRKAEARFNVALYGPGRDMKQRAIETLQRLTQVAV